MAVSERLQGCKNDMKESWILILYRAFHVKPQKGGIINEPRAEISPLKLWAAFGHKAYGSSKKQGGNRAAVNR